MKLTKTISNEFEFHENRLEFDCTCKEDQQNGRHFQSGGNEMRK